MLSESTEFREFVTDRVIHTKLANMLKGGVEMGEGHEDFWAWKQSIS